MEALKKDGREPVQDFLERASHDPNYKNTRWEMESPQRSPEEFVRALSTDLQSGRAVALADVMCANGSDLILGDQLMHHPEVAQLKAYGGWNTAGNTLGTVLAQAMIQIVTAKQGFSAQQEQAHLEFLFSRFLDDYCYQVRERTLVYLEDLPSLGLPLSEEHLDDADKAARVEQCVRNRLLRSAVSLEKVFVQSGKVKAVQVDHIYLPWQRLFEVGFETRVTLP